MAHHRFLQPLLGLGLAPLAHLDDVPEALALGVDANALSMDAQLTHALARWVDLKSHRLARVHALVRLQVHQLGV
eukprot:7661814-Alexandrium_andersonii.AAC.1